MSASECEFESIISDQLGKLQRELVHQCQLHALQREEHLHHTIDKLQLEIQILRAGGDTTEPIIQQCISPAVMAERHPIDHTPAASPARTQPTIGSKESTNFDSTEMLECRPHDIPARRTVKSVRASTPRHSHQGHAVQETLTLVERPKSFKEGIWDEWLEDSPGEAFYLTAESHFNAIELRMRSLGKLTRKRTGSISMPMLRQGSVSSLDWRYFISRIGIISPASPVRLYWDVMGVPALLYDLVTIPLGVYDIPPHLAANAAFWVILLYWTADIFMSFCSGYFDKSGDVILKPSAIARHYLAGYFWLDLLVILADWIPIFLSAFGIGAGSRASTVRILRVFRSARFIRLLRLRRLRDMGAAFEDYIDSVYTSVVYGVLVNILGIIAINHFIACAWYGVGSLKFAGYTSWTAVQDFDSMPWEYQYLTSLHWAITQFTPGGTNIQCHNPAERVFAVGTLLFALVVFSSFVSSLTQARLELQALTSKYEKEGWRLRRYLRQRHASKELSIRIIHYINAKVVANADLLEGKDIVLLDRLSRPLWLDLQVEVFGRHVIKHRFFTRLSQISHRSMTDLCDRVLSSVSLGHGDLLFHEGCMCETMYLAIDGRMLYFFNHSPAVLHMTCGQHCCEAALWTKWVHAGSMGCDEAATLVTVDNEEFRKVIIEDPVAWAFAIDYAGRFISLITGEERNIGPDGLHDLHGHVIVDTFAMSERPQSGDGVQTVSGPTHQS